MTEFSDRMVYVVFYLPIYFGFLIAIPLFLDKKRHHVLTLRDIISDTLRSSVRLIVPLSLFFFIFILPLILAATNNPAFLRDVLQEVQRQQKDPTLTDVLIPAIIVTLLTLTPFYFSLKKKNIFSAALNSISAIIAHPLYLAFILFVFLVQTFIKEVLTFDSLLANIALMIPTAYLFLLAYAVNLVYFQDEIEHDAEKKHVVKNPILFWITTSSPQRNMLIVLLLLTVVYVLFYKP